MNIKLGTRIQVKPIVFYPEGVSANASWNSIWTTLHQAVQEKYSQMLKGRDSFELAPLRVIDGSLTAAQYKDLCFRYDGLKHENEVEVGQCSQGVETILAEILSQPFEDGRSYSRYTLPFCLSVLMVDRGKQWGSGGGRTLNGDANLGGGIQVMPSWHLENGTLTSTLVHELGHTFGLVHSNGRGPQSGRAGRIFKSSELYRCYYDIDSSRSVMSYNTDNQTNATAVDEIPGCLLGDEIHALSGNKYVFPELTFDPRQDFGCAAERECPAHDKEVRENYFGPMTLTWCTTTFESGIQGGTASRLNDTPSRWILGSHPQIGFVGSHMWHSSEANAEGWVSLDVTFPTPVDIDRVLVFTEHSGAHHRAVEVQIEREAREGTFIFVKRVVATGRDTEVEFPSASAWRWRIALKAGSSKQVVVRGLRFFKGDYEWFPPLGPDAITGFGETHGSRVTNLVEIQRSIRENNASVGFDERSMWHSGKVNDAGWVSVEVTFPTPVTLDKIGVYSQHSGSFHRAERVQVETADTSGDFSFVAAETLSHADGNVTFAAKEAKTWKLAFRGDEYVVVRGLRFYVGDEEFYPPAKVA